MPFFIAYQPLIGRELIPAVRTTGPYANRESAAYDAAGLDLSYVIIEAETKEQASEKGLIAFGLRAPNPPTDSTA
jgi:hypothetical protein